MINRAKLANLLNVSPPAVTKILNGNSNFTLKTLISLADALDMELKVDFVEKQVTAEEAADGAFILAHGIYSQAHGIDAYGMLTFTGNYDPNISSPSEKKTDYADASASTTYTGSITDLDYYREAA